MNKIIAAVRRFFGRKNTQSVSDDSNPWADVKSYGRFCGRNREVSELFDIVENNFIVTLYGENRVGKTSLIRGGLSPRLRACGYQPVYISLGIIDNADFIGGIVENIDYDLKQECAAEAVENELTSTSKLLRYLTTHSFINKSGERVIPVIVFDQFEEVLRYNGIGALDLLRELSIIADPHNAIAGSYNFRFLLSIREEDFPGLEDFVGHNSMSGIINCRYKLLKITDEEISKINSSDLESDHEQIDDPVDNPAEHPWLLMNTSLLTKDSNPWVGLMSYAEPAAGGADLRFCGRDREIIDLFYLVDNNFIVTLYGKSGIGKTSLLNAGLFPRLRAEGYHPVPVRLGLVKNQDLVGQIIDIIDKEMKDSYGVDSIEGRYIGSINASAPDSRLWRYFATHRFHDKVGEVVFPVMVFDQFEEVLRHNGAGALELLRELSFVADPHNAIADGIVDGKPYTYDFNFRFVLSIREDDLYRLEDIVDRNFIARIKDCRYRLQNLSDEGAASVVGDIGEPYIEPADRERVVSLVTAASRSAEDGLVNTNMLSLLCYRMYQRYTDSKAPKITAAMVDNFISANPFEEYYEEAVKDLSEGEKRFIEDRLIDPDGRRASVSEKEFKTHVRNSSRLFNGRSRILQCVSAGTGSKSINVELLHDAMCPTILRNRTLRLERKTGSITALWLIIIGAVSYYFLNDTIVNNFVNFFLACMGATEFTFGSVEAVALLLTIITFPIMTGVLVYGYRIPYILMALPSLMALLPVAFFRDTEAFSPMGIATMAVGGIATAMFFISWKSKNNSLSTGKALAKVWGLLPVKLFYLLLACYLYYKSVLNPAFVISNTDSAWGIIVIPFLFLDCCLSFFGLKHQWKLTAAYLCVLVLMAAGTFILEIGIWVELGGLLVCLMLLWLLSYGITTIRRIAFTVVNVVFLTVILGFNLGFNPLAIKAKEAKVVYPWKLVVVEKNGLYGTADAQTGEMIIDAQFDSINGFYLERIIDNSPIDTGEFLTKDLPLFFVHKDGKIQLCSFLYIKLEGEVNRLNHKKHEGTLTDSITVKSAEAFIKLRNAYIEYIINSNDSLLQLMPYEFIDLNSMLQRNLDEKLRVLSDNAKSIDESMVCDMIEALTLCMYIDMMSEALLKEHYTDVCEWFLQYYLSVLLTDALPDGYTVNYGGIYQSDLNVNGNSYKEPDVNMSFSNKELKELAKHKAAAWYNMFYRLFIAECGADRDAYIEAMQSNNKALDNLVAQSEAYKQQMAAYQLSLQGILASVQKTYDDQDQLLSGLKESALLPDSLKSENLERTIKGLLEITPKINSVKQNLGVIMADIAASGMEMDSVMSSMDRVLLEYVDKDFKNLIQSTYNSLLDIVRQNPNNIYNGLFITVCERLYTMGAFRLYDMSEYKEKMDAITIIRVSGMYQLVLRTDSLRNEQNGMLDFAKERLNESMSDLQQMQNRFDALSK